ncbi:Uncharacterized protein PHSC3_001631 [Chlamydiales bacterium STE3]|nr:Uncharacterized protein PHSC3_001631 [Chlamydiales bacterium STE3]
MPNCKIINSISEINLNKSWSPATKFNSKDRLVDAKGNKVRSDYQGHQYRIIEKRERTFSTLEVVGRRFLGTLVVICTLSLALFAKPVRNLFTKQKENIRFAISTSQIEHNISEQELQQGIFISGETISNIQTCMRNIFQGEEEDGVKFYKNQRTRKVFTLDTVPDLIFKSGESMVARYQNIIKAQTIVRTHQLNLLVIPNAQLFTLNIGGKEHAIIAEKRVDIDYYESVQEQHFQDYADSLNETIRQLAIFICLSGYSNVEWRNNPILNEAFDEHGNRKIALIDLEKCKAPEAGLFGRSCRGLVGCVTEEQGKIVLNIARQYGISTKWFDTAHDVRKKEIADGHRLQKYYAKKNITTGDKPVQIDENSLDFSDHPKEAERLKAITKDLIKAINEKISETSAEDTIKKRRYIYINTNEGPFKYLDREEFDNITDQSPYPIDEEFNDASYLGHIVKKLVKLRVIYGLVKRNGYGYYLQA